MGYGENDTATMKGILLAGGRGTRFGPCSLVQNKHLLPVFDQPMIYHPLALLMRAGIRDICLVSGPEHLPLFRRLLGSGADFGIRLRYVTQPDPAGISDAIGRCRDRVGEQRFCVALGDNLFQPDRVDGALSRALTADSAVILACRDESPSQFGVVELDKSGRPVRLEEKPSCPRSDLVVPGLYVYPPETFAMLESLSPSERGELEVSALNQAWLDRGGLRVESLPDQGHWLDMGTPERLARATALVRQWEVELGEKPGCPEAVAWRRGWVEPALMKDRVRRLNGSDYGRYLAGLLIDGTGEGA